MQKQAFSDIYRDQTPLETELTFNNAARSLAAQHLMYLGDMCKLIERFNKKDKQKPNQTAAVAKTQDEAWNFYTRSKTVYPFDGKIYHSFAVLSKKENDYLASIYFLMRALASNLPHEASRELLINYFEEMRIKYLDFKKNDSKRQTNREDKKFLAFLLSHFRIQGILFTRIGIDELADLFDN
jgi:hypothetical protein